ncbi:MAG: hypothetical protein JSU82_05300 [Rhodospirillales bacterium]|nr:MAG: hypothetical protein JSU82_05300 [Rhodospirillales bacterium]
MLQRYVVKPLGAGKVMQAYPLVQTAVPHLTLEQWLDYAEQVCETAPHEASATGVMSAENGDGYIYGIYCHEVATDIQHGRILKVSNLIAANLYDASGIMDRMIDSMLKIARDKGCAAVHVDLPESPRKGPQPVEGLAGMLKGAGYRFESVALCRPLEEN